MADFISKERLGSVEPITNVVGITEDGDMLIEDRNGVRYSLPAAILPKPEPVVVVESIETDFGIVNIVDHPEPAPKPKRKPRAKKAK